VVSIEVDVPISPVDRDVFYELKAVDRWHAKHKAQLIHYLMISGVQHGKLINFRPASVASFFCNFIYARGVAWYLSAFSHSMEHQGQHLVRLLRCLKLEKILWFIIEKSKVSIQTLTPSSCQKNLGNCQKLNKNE